MVRQEWCEAFFVKSVLALINIVYSILVVVNTSRIMGEKGMTIDELRV